MALEPFFSLTPVSPTDYTYDPANPNAPYASGYFYAYGGIAFYYSPYRLNDQATNDEIILGYDAVDPAEQNIGSVANDIYKRCAIRVAFAGYNVNANDQYLLLFALRGLSKDVTAQFFVGADLVRAESLSGDEQVAILLDVPGDGSLVYIYVRLASPHYWVQMGFKGMECYLL